MSTFHSFCVTLLRDEALEAGVDPFFSPVTPADRLALLLDRIDELSLRHHEIRGNPAPLLASFVARIDRLKDELVSAEELLALGRARCPRAPTPSAPARSASASSPRLYADHDRLLGERGALDFGDLIVPRVPPAARVPARARAHRAPLPPRARRRVPGHELRPGHAAAPARRRTTRT